MKDYAALAIVTPIIVISGIMLTLSWGQPPQPHTQTFAQNLAQASAETYAQVHDKALNQAHDQAHFLQSAVHADTHTRQKVEILPPIHIVSQELPKAYWPDGDGDYNRVFDRLVADYAGEVNTLFLPSERLIRHFVHKAADCVYIATDNMDAYAHHGITRDMVDFIGPVNQIMVTAFVRQDAPDIARPQDLADLSFAIDVNLREVVKPYGLTPALSLQSQVQMIDLLQMGRIDALVGFDYDLMLLSRELDLIGQVKPTSINLMAMKDGMICHRNSQTAAFVAHTRKNLETARKKGFLTDIFGK